MISIGNFNNPVTSSRGLQNLTNKNLRPPEIKPTNLTEDNLDKSKQSLKLYTELSETSHHNQSNNLFRDNLSYSSLTAINQYTKNYNLERTENTNRLIGLSIYA